MHCLTIPPCWVSSKKKSPNTNTNHLHTLVFHYSDLFSPLTSAVSENAIPAAQCPVSWLKGVKSVLYLQMAAAANSCCSSAPLTLSLMGGGPWGKSHSTNDN